MDYVRSCYSTKMRFFPDDPAHLSTVQWYFADPSALAFPGYHRFASLNWSSRVLPSGPLGEVSGQSRPYSKGSIAGRPLGQHFDGQRSFFTNGCPLGGTGLNRTPSGIPVDCATFQPNRCVGAGEATPTATCSIPGDLPHLLVKQPFTFNTYNELPSGFFWFCQNAVPVGMVLERTAGTNIYRWAFSSFDGVTWVYSNPPVGTDPAYPVGTLASVHLN